MSNWHPPADWDETKYQEMLDRIEGEAKDLEAQRTPAAWSYHREHLNAVVRAWSWSVVRLAKAICQLLRSGDMITALALMRELRERAIDLGLLLHYKAKAVGYSDTRHSPRRHIRFANRCEAALAARLNQAMTHYHRALAEPGWQASGWVTLKDEIAAMKRRLPQPVYDQISRRTADWSRFAHWSGVDDNQLRGRLSGVDPMQDPLAPAKMSIQLHQSLALMEVERVSLGGNHAEYRPARQATPGTITVVALVVWFYLRAAARAAQMINENEEC
jgi:hypothetical protein